MEIFNFFCFAYFSLIPYNDVYTCSITVPGSFTGSSDFGVTASTGYNVVEGTNVTFTCKAHVGANPQGQLLWYYIIGNTGSPQPISDQAITQSPEPYKTCGYTRVSTLTLTMTQVYNGVVLRCTLQQSGVSITDDHRQTTDFNVTCKYFMSMTIHTIGTA